MTDKSWPTLLDYWLAKAYPDGASNYSFRAPPEDIDEYSKWKSEYDRYQSGFAGPEASAWNEVCTEAADEQIDIWAFRHVDRPEPRTYYPTHYASALREKIAPAFFKQPNTMIGPGEANRVIIYYLGKRPLGGPYNAPWVDPIVDRKQSGAMPLYSKVTDFLSARAERLVAEGRRSSRENDREAANAHFGVKIPEKFIRSWRNDLPIDHPFRKRGPRQRQ